MKLRQLGRAAAAHPPSPSRGRGAQRCQAGKRQSRVRLGAVMHFNDPPSGLMDKASDPKCEECGQSPTWGRASALTPSVRQPPRTLPRPRPPAQPAARPHPTRARPQPGRRTTTATTILCGRETLAAGPVAQWIRHRPTEPGIAGSSPAGVIEMHDSAKAHARLLRACLAPLGAPPISLDPICPTAPSHPPPPPPARPAGRPPPPPPPTHSPSAPEWGSLRSGPTRA